MVELHRSGYLEGTSNRSDSSRELTHGHYDLIVLSSSWDPRCLCVTESPDLTSEHAALFLFDIRDNRGLRDKHDAALVAYLEKQTVTRDILHGHSANVRGVWDQAQTVLLRLYESRHRKPLRLFLDLSTCPRFLSLGLVTYALVSGMASFVSVFYAEGDYPRERSEQDRHDLFTSGGWAAVPVPGLEGVWSPSKRRAFVVSVGFEGSKTLRLISREEPDDVFVLFPDPGVRAEYVDRAKERNQILLSRLRTPAADVVRAAAGDAIHAWKQLDEATIERPAEQNVSYVCCGTKPHSLALALRAAIQRYPSVLYIVPDRHNAVDIGPLGVYWRYDLRDITALA